MALKQEPGEQERDDSLPVEAAKIALSCGKVSTSLLQSRLKIGCGRAAKILDHLIDLEYV